MDTPPSSQPAGSSLAALLARGARALHNRDALAALAAFRLAWLAAPASAQVHCGQGMGQALLGQHDAALAEFSEAVRLEPANVDALSLRALTLARLGRSAEAQADIRALAQQLGGPDFLIGAFFSRILELGDAEAVLAVTQAWLAAFPASVAPLAAQATALQELQRHTEYQRLMAFSPFLKVIRQFDATVAWDGAEPLNQALASAILSATKVDTVRDRKATKIGQQTVHLDPQSAPALRAFFAALARAVEGHARHVTACLPDHPWVRMKPQGFQVAAWGVALEAGGHQNPHIHPAAWLSGVYYPRLPAGAVGAQPPAGWLEIGRAGSYARRPENLQVQMVPPQEGTLVLFPSYYWHSTGPAAAPGRMSLAFDIVAPGRGRPLEQAAPAEAQTSSHSLRM